jgi:energy-coupling factor transporter ATP-binding protein EcfA2
MASAGAFLAVIGPSGSGKSSLVRAGLIPALKAGAAPGSERWRYLTIKPGARPLDALAAGLARLAGDAGDAAPRHLGHAIELRRALAESEHGLLLAADLLGLGRDGSRLVLVVDQCEELWALAPSDPCAQQPYAAEQRGPLIRALLAAAAAPDQPVLVVLTLRADFLHRAAEDGDLAGWIGAHDLIVGPMRRDELRAAIEKPAIAADGWLEPGLVDELIARVEGRAGALPLLAYTLLELWKARRADGALTWEAYRALGGVEGALAARADAIVAAHYTHEQQPRLRQLLVRLVQPDEGSTGVRRGVPLDDLVPAGGSADAIRALLQPLIDERLLVISVEPIILSGAAGGAKDLGFQTPRDASLRSA